MLINCSKTGKKAAQYVEHLLSEGYLVRDQSNGRGLPGDGFFRITIGTQQDMDEVYRIIRDCAEN